MPIPMPAEAYSELPYQDRPVAESHPCQLFAIARRWNVVAKQPDNARVLELGCAHGVNLMPMASRLPDATFLGVDLAANQIERGAGWVRRLGLRNLELRCADVAELELPPASFDYVIAHGLFSWVSDRLRERILVLCSRVLAPGGVAYVSYNAMPAWGVRNGIRHALSMAVGDASGAVEQVRRARAALTLLGKTNPLGGTAEGALMEHEIRELSQKPDAYLLHEYLAPEHRAFYLNEFAKLAEGHGLRYLDDVAPTGVDEDVFEATQAAFAAEYDDPLIAAQLTDVAIFRQFRASLLVRADESVARKRGAPTFVRTESVVVGERPCALDLTRFEAAELGFVSTAEHSFAPLDPFHASLIELLDGTRTLEALCEAMLERVNAGVVSLSTQAGTPPSSEELRSGLPHVVGEALKGFASSGLLL